MEPEDLEPRVSGLEEQVSDLRRDLGEARQDSDMAAIFRAERQDFVDLRDHVDRGFMEMRGKFDAMAAGQQQIVELLQTLIDRDEAS